MKSLETQIGGDHYRSMAIQPTEYIVRNKLSFPEGCVIKYVSRHRFKGGKQDLEKAIHYLQVIIESEYGEHDGEIQNRIRAETDTRHRK